MIGVVPILFLVYFSIFIYKEKSQRVKLIGDYVEQIDQSENVSHLISQLARERRFSFKYVLQKSNYDSVLAERLKTDEIVKTLSGSRDLALANYAKYTFLDKLADTRIQIDTSKNYSADKVVQYYTDAIFRINTIYSAAPSSNIFLEPVYQDLIAQKILSQMVTYLGIMRTNIYKALYTRRYMTETLLATLGVYKVYNSYETEFLLKASPASIKFYEAQKSSAGFQAANNYIDHLFTTFQFDSTYNAEEWLQVSLGMMNVLKQQQSALWQNADTKMKDIYEHEKATKNGTFIFLIVALLFVIAFVTYFVNHITSLFRKLKLAARKISRGGTGIELSDMPAGVMANLAKSIMQIDHNNRLLAQAANEIGKGNFDVTVTPRSAEDLLGISIKKMKHELREFNSQRDKIQKETEELVYKRDEFFSIASHELRTPLTSLKAYTQLLLMDSAESHDVHHAKMFKKMDIQVEKLNSLITDLLDISKLQNGKLTYNKQPFVLRQLVMEIIEEIRLTSSGHEVIFKANTNAQIRADRERIGQVLSNLLQNALRYAPLSKKIIVEVKQEKDKVICSVQDFGTGISEQERDKIFERFYRISGNNLHTYPGLGIGLFISKEIIEKHDGKMWLDSELGKGSIFYFELPLN